MNFYIFIHKKNVIYITFPYNCQRIKPKYKKSINHFLIQKKTHEEGANFLSNTQGIICYKIRRIISSIISGSWRMVITKTDDTRSWPTFIHKISSSQSKNILSNRSRIRAINLVPKFFTAIYVYFRCEKYISTYICTLILTLLLMINNY